MLTRVVFNLTSSQHCEPVAFDNFSRNNIIIMSNMKQSVKPHFQRPRRESELLI